jgi:hypothetical protein
MFDKLGYGPVFRWTAAFGFLSVLFVSLEWIRVSAAGRREKKDAIAAAGQSTDQSDPARQTS